MTRKFTILHSSSHLKNHYGDAKEDDYGTEHYTGFGDFFPHDKLQRDGFIFPDGSLRFEFFVKKNNYQQRLELEKEKNKALLHKIAEFTFSRV